MNGFSMAAPKGLASFSGMRTLREYSLACILSVLFSFIILQIYDFKYLNFPFNYFGDTVFYSTTIKSVIKTGWYLQDPSIGAPNGYCLADYPTPEGMNYLIIKLLTLFSSNWVLVLNIFFLLGFPLITSTSLFVFKRLGMCYPFALTASLLFAFLPYHLIREESHLCLSAYQVLPLIIWLALLIYQNQLPENAYKKKGLFFVYCLSAILLGSNGIYYAYFGGFFILLGGLVGSYTSKQWRPLKYALLFITIITASIVVNVWPTLHYQMKKGINSEAIVRDSIEAETQGLKITQLLLPRDGDRLFSTLKEKYNNHALSISENTSASLGLIGSLGFLYLIGHLFLKRKKALSPLMDGLADFNLSAVLIGTIGGFSSLIAFFFLPQIRGYNRISVFIAFFALTAFFLLLQNRIKNSRALWCISLLLLGFGLYNQTSPMDAPFVKYSQIPDEFRWDQTFVQEIEKTLPPGSMVFQLPYICFPEGPRDQINSYAHFKPALHSNTLKWSFGAMKGRKVDLWQRKTSSLDVPNMIQELLRKGFTGLYVDKFGYKDEGVAIMTRLRGALTAPPIFDKHGRSFWDLRSINSQDMNLSGVYLIDP